MRKATAFTFLLGEKRREVRERERKKLQGLDWRVIQNLIETKFYPRDPLVKLYSSTGLDFEFSFSFGNTLLKPTFLTVLVLMGDFVAI